MHEHYTGKGMHNYTLISGWLYVYVAMRIYTFAEIVPKISISISLSGNVVITIHVLPVCSSRPDLDVRHAWCAPSVFLHVGKFFVGAGGT